MKASHRSASITFAFARMKFDEIHKLVGHVPFISKRNAELLYATIIDHRLTNVLELGIAHGTATCYMAAALEELGSGCVTAVDLVAAAGTFRPSAEEQLKATGLERFAVIHRMQSGYTWFLHDEIRRQTADDKCQAVYDLCIIDGPKHWTIDGCAFFLVDKLLNQNGWLIFDDYMWTYQNAGREVTDGISNRAMSEEERRSPQVREVFELLVKQHPNYSEFEVSGDGNWASARKIASDTKDYHVIHRETYADFFGYMLRRLANRFFPK
jgi:predicted O-methyltransferase YrrM